MSAFQMTAELAWASWETIIRRALMMAQSTCSPAEYHRMLSEKTAAALEIGGAAVRARWRLGGSPADALA